MRTAHPLGLSPDGRSLIVVLDDEQVAIPADERLKAALRNDRARIGQLEIDMESALRPRDIQARIRAGESLETVAEAAGVPIARIEPFAAPVIAERDHIAGLAQTNPVRRAGDAVAHRSLRNVVTDRLLSSGIDIDDVEWDAGDVLVVGSSESGPVSAVFLGSRATKIVRYSPVPVIAVPRGAAQELAAE